MQALETPSVFESADFSAAAGHVRKFYCDQVDPSPAMSLSFASHGTPIPHERYRLPEARANDSAAVDICSAGGCYLRTRRAGPFVPYVDPPTRA